MPLSHPSVPVSEFFVLCFLSCKKSIRGNVQCQQLLEQVIARPVRHKCKLQKKKLVHSFTLSTLCLAY